MNPHKEALSKAILETVNFNYREADQVVQVYETSEWWAELGVQVAISRATALCKYSASWLVHDAVGEGLRETQPLSSDQTWL